MLNNGFVVNEFAFFFSGFTNTFINAKTAQLHVFSVFFLVNNLKFIQNS